MTEDDTFRRLKQSSMEEMMKDWWVIPMPNSTTLSEAQSLFRKHLHKHGWTAEEFNKQKVIPISV